MAAPSRRRLQGLRGIGNKLFRQNAWHSMWKAASGRRGFYRTICAVFVLFLFLDTSYGEPRLECGETVFDFGTVTDDDTVRHRFTLKNTGSSTLHINRVHAPCGCAATKLSTMQIDPGQETVLEAELRLAGRAGKQNQSILIASNDPQNPRTYLWMNGFVEPELQLIPANINFGDLETSDSRTIRVDMRSRRDGVRITGIENPSRSFAVSSIAGSNTTEHTALEIKTRPPLGDGRHSSSIVVITNHPRRQRVVLPVFARVAGEISVVPEVIAVRKRPTERMKAFILLRPGTVATYKVRSVSVPDSRITASFGELMPGTWRIDLDGIPYDKALSGKVIEITTDLDAMHTVRVPLQLVP